jgi:hypothetical protein
MGRGGKAPETLTIGLGRKWIVSSVILQAIEVRYGASEPF